MRQIRNNLTALILVMAFLPASGLRAQFLDFSQPSRAAAMGGNLVALPYGPSGMVFNPAGLATQERFEVSARFESLFPGLENDDISTGNITLLTSAEEYGTLGGSWDHMGSNLLQQDRFKLGWGRRLGSDGPLKDIAAGLSLSYIDQRYVLSTPLAGVPVSKLSSGSFGFGGGLLATLPWKLTLGVSVDDVNQPNLGVVGQDRLPILVRWGLAEDLVDRGPVRLTVTGAQSLADSDLETQGGLEFFFPDQGFRVRGGLGPDQAGVGLGYEGQDLFVDYSYLFSASSKAQLSGVGLPGSHLVEMGVKWGGDSSERAFRGTLAKARGYEAAGQWDKALWSYQDCLNLRPDDPTVLASRKSALLHYNEERARKYYQEGMADEQQGSLLDARYNYEMAAKLVPDDPNYVKALDRASEPPQAQVIQASNSAGTARRLVNEAEIYLTKGRPDMATSYLKRAEKIQPQNLEIKQRLAQLAAPAPELSPDKVKEADGLYEKGLNDYLGGDLDGAIRSWEEVLRIDPLRMKAQNNLIRAKLEKESEKP